MHLLFYACVYTEIPHVIQSCSVTHSYQNSKSGYDISDIFWCVSNFVSPSSLTERCCSLCQCVDCRSGVPASVSFSSLVCGEVGLRRCGVGKYVRLNVNSVIVA